jgi:small-conductance mechanosensitive channel
MVKNRLYSLSFLLLLFLVYLPFAGFSRGSLDTGKRQADTLHLKLVKAKAALTHISASSKRVAGPKQVRLAISEVKKSLAPIRDELKDPKKRVDNHRLAGFRILLKRSQDKLGAYRKVLSRSAGDLQDGAKQLVKIKKDTVLTVGKSDSAAGTAYAAQFAEMKDQLATAGKAVSASLDTVNNLLRDVSVAYLQIIDLQADVEERLKVPAPGALHQETSYLWSAPKETSEVNISNNLSSTYAWQNKVLGDFMDRTWDDRLLAILLGCLFFLWVYLNYRKAKLPEQQKLLGELDFKHIVPLPFTGAVIVTLVLSPLCQADAPFQYMELIHFLLLIALSVFFWRRLLRSHLLYWLFMVLLFVVIEFTAAAVHNSLFLRLWFIFLNLGSLYFGVVFSRKVLRTEAAQSLIRPVLIIYLALNGLAVALNVFGRISLAKAFSGTAIIGITEVIGLAVFIHLLTDALELQIKLSACNGGLFSRLDIPSTRLSVKKLLAGVSIVIWLLVFMINLGISKEVWGFINKLLDNRRTFGSVSFTIGNVLFFALILYLSNLSQKNIGVLFGEKRVSFNNEVEHGSSKLTLFRLVIATVGVLLAVTASGIPLDKLTVVLGALSVGIGLGMQNIVNNFVSGIILIFEKPFRIGDFVELGDKKGKIQDIGIRASKMLTQQGSEVIIPNGDLISNRFTNWTINSANVKSEVLLKVPITADLAMVTSIIKEEIGQAEGTVKNAVPDILINSIGADAIELRVLIWILSVYAEPAFKSSLFSKLITRFNAAQVKIM